MSKLKKRIRGYEAADIIIKEMLADAKLKLKPRAKGRERKKIDWWRGYHSGLLAAHCFMVYGQFPEYHQNPDYINAAMEREKKRVKDLTQ